MSTWIWPTPKVTIKASTLRCCRYVTELSCPLEPTVGGAPGSPTKPPSTTVTGLVLGHRFSETSVARISSHPTGYQSVVQRFHAVRSSCPRQEVLWSRVFVWLVRSYNAPCDCSKSTSPIFTARSIARPTSQFWKLQMVTSPQGVVRSTSCLVLRWGFWGRRIEWRYFRFD